MCSDLAAAAAVPSHQALCSLLRCGALPTLRRLERAPPRALAHALLALATARPYALCEAVLLPLFHDHATWTGGQQALFSKILGGGGKRDAAEASAPLPTVDTAGVFLELWTEDEAQRHPGAEAPAWTAAQMAALEVALTCCQRLPPMAAAGLCTAAEKQGTHQLRSLPFCKLLLTLVRQHGDVVRPHCDTLMRAVHHSKAFLAKSVLSALKKLGTA